MYLIDYDWLFVHQRLFHSTKYFITSYIPKYIFLPPRSKIEWGGGYCFLENLYLANNFWTVSSRALIFHISIPCVKTFQCVSTFFTLWPLSWSLTLFYNFNVGNNFWTVAARALVFHMNTLWDKTFQWVPTALTLWPWSLTYFLKKL